MVQFDSWPEEFRTKNNWASICREVIPGQNPVAQHGEFYNSESNDVSVKESPAAIAGPSPLPGQVAPRYE